MLLTVAYSPCPNDTFMFHALATGSLGLEGHEIQTHLHDVETLNQKALAGVYDVTKVSFPAYFRVRAAYRLLDAGAAVGFGCGPIVVAKRDTLPTDVGRLRVAVPGELTAAYLLLRLWAPQVRDFLMVPYHQIMDLVAKGEADCGVLIHEGRFVYAQAGLRCVADLGQWWQERTGLPIPLGCIVARRSLGDETIRRFEETLRLAIRHSLDHPQDTADYVRRHAQEMDPETLQKHIRTFVNEFSLDLGPRGHEAVARLQELAEQAGALA